LILIGSPNRFYLSIEGIAGVKKGRGRYNSRIGKLVFILPAIIIIILVVYAYVQLNSPGTLIVRAESKSGSPFSVVATVNGKTGTTPFTLTLAQGNYQVTFPSLTWYYPAQPHDVTVLPGTTVYAVAVYDPIGKVIQVNPSGFNSTTVTALHGVTQVNFTNPSGSVVTVQGAPFGNVALNPGQTLSSTYQVAGTYRYTFLSGNQTVTVDVS
jgi:hypothetical protein